MKGTEKNADAGASGTTATTAGDVATAPVERPRSSSATPSRNPSAQSSAQAVPTKKIVKKKLIKKKVKKKVKKAVRQPADGTSKPSAGSPSPDRSKTAAGSTKATEGTTRKAPTREASSRKDAAKPSSPGASQRSPGRPARRGTAQRAPANPPDASPGSNEPAATVDGKIDVDATIRSRAKTVKASELARRHKNVQVLGMETIRGLIRDAVAEAAGHFEQSLGAEQKSRLLEEAEEAFQERLESFKAEKAGLEAHSRNLQEQLDRAQELLEEERQRIVSADQFTVSDAGMIEIEQRLSRMLDRSVARGGIGDDLENEMRAVVAKLLDDERDKISAKAQEAQSDRVDLLERKIARLASSLEDTQKERDLAKRHAQALEEAGGRGLRNVISGGILGDDPDKERKLELMKEIFRANREMYAELDKRGDRPTRRSQTSSLESVVAPEPEVSSETPPAAKRDDRTFESRQPEPDTTSEQAAGSDLEADVDGSDALKSQEPHEDVSESSDGSDLPSGDNHAEDTVVVEEEIDPDDLPWQPPTSALVQKEISVTNSSGVRSISVKQFAPPPLTRRREGGDVSTDGGS